MLNLNQRRCEKVGFFTVAIKTKYSISISELNRIHDANNPQIATLIGGLQEEAAEQKAVSILNN